MATILLVWFTLATGAVEFRMEFPADCETRSKELHATLPADYRRIRTRCEIVEIVEI